MVRDESQRPSLSSQRLSQCSVRMSPYRIFIYLISFWFYSTHIFDMVFETFLFHLQYLRVSFTVACIVYLIDLKAICTLIQKDIYLFNYSYIEAHLSHLSFGLFILLLYYKKCPCGWMSSYTSFGQHIAGYYDTTLHSDSRKRTLVTDFRLEWLSRSTGETPWYRPELCEGNMYQKFSNMRLFPYW